MATSRSAFLRTKTELRCTALSSPCRPRTQRDLWFFLKAYGQSSKTWPKFHVKQGSSMTSVPFLTRNHYKTINTSHQSHGRIYQSIPPCFSYTNPPPTKPHPSIHVVRWWSWGWWFFGRWSFCCFGPVGQHWTTALEKAVGTISRFGPVLSPVGWDPVGWGGQVGSTLVWDQTLNKKGRKKVQGVGRVWITLGQVFCWRIWRG